MDLCGHATLATAHVIKKHLHYQGEILNFKTLSGDVKVSISNDKYFLDFPSRMPVDNSLPNNLKEGDYIEIGQLGAYSLTFRTKFNGFYSDKIFEVNDKPIMSMYEKDNSSRYLVA